MEGEELRASSESGSDDEAYGQPLLEVLSVHIHGGRSPRGSVAVFDGKRGQNIYIHNGEPAPSTSPCLFQMVVLPFRRVLVDLYDPTTKYDQVISSKVDTGYGRVEVKYAALSNAVECDVQVKLLIGDDSVPTHAHGTILPRSELLQHEIVLFNGEITRASAVSPELIIPLARSVLAVPLMWHLDIKVDLRGPTGEQIVKDSVKFNPGTDDRLILYTLANNCKVEVMVVWSYEEDY